MNIKYIAKREGFEVILFFPEYGVSKGRIQHWDGCHGETSLAYFKSLKPTKDTGKMRKAREIDICQ